MKIFTLGFTKKNAEQFFDRLKQPGLLRVVDIRLNNSSQLAGFTKKDDIKYFLRKLCEIDYVYLPELAPTKEILNEYKNNGGDWVAYEHQFLKLMQERGVAESLDQNMIDGCCLLCSEATPEHCHRRLVAEYLRGKWKDVEIQHL